MPGGLVPAPLLAELIARGATVAFIGAPDTDPETRYRPSPKLDTFVRNRDLTGRHPGCDRPADHADIDHTTAWPAGPTHPSNTKCYCRKHHRFHEKHFKVAQSRGLGYDRRPATGDQHHV